MGGVGTFKLGAQFPDLFARAAADRRASRSSTDVLASLRNVPVLMWNNTGDELVNDGCLQRDGGEARLARLPLRARRSSALRERRCSPLFPNHLQLAVNDQYAPAADFLGTREVDRNPRHVTYVVDPDAQPRGARAWSATTPTGSRA